MLNITILALAGAEWGLSSTIVALLIIIICILGLVAAVPGSIWLLIQAFLAIKHPVSKKGFHRRKFILVVCALVCVCALAQVGFMLADNYDSDNRRKFNTELSVDYAKSYEHPVILPKTLDYKIAFEEKWGQIEIYSPDGATLRFKIIQAPLTAAGRKYFDVSKGNCSFEQMRENWDKPSVENEPCKLHDSVGEFKVYKSNTSIKSNFPDSSYYAVYNNIVVSIDAVPDDVMKVVADMKVTDSRELVTVFEGDKFSGSYPAILDIWRKEGRF